MSRIGKKPVEFPKDVTVAVAGDTVKVKGPKGELQWVYPDRLRLRVEDGKLVVERTVESKVDRALHGMARSLINNMVAGVSAGYTKVLDIMGVGYKAQVAGGKIVFNLGYSHPVEFPLPEGIKATTDPKQTQITITGIDKQKVGQVAADIKALRPPDAYKGKGIRYAGQRLKLKAGKAGKK